MESILELLLAPRESHSISFFEVQQEYKEIKKEKRLVQDEIKFEATSLKDDEAYKNNLRKLILGASNDFLTPLSRFENDARFQRNNIKIVNIQNAGHFSWLGYPNAIKDTVRSFAKEYLLD